MMCVACSKWELICSETEFFILKHAFLVQSQDLIQTERPEPSLETKHHRAVRWESVSEQVLWRCSLEHQTQTHSSICPCVCVFEGGAETRKGRKELWLCFLWLSECVCVCVCVLAASALQYLQSLCKHVFPSDGQQVALRPCFSAVNHSEKLLPWRTWAFSRLWSRPV